MAVTIREKWMHIKSRENVPAFANPHGEVVYELIGMKAGGSSQHSLAQITILPGKASRKHYHPVAEESYYIVAGRGRIEMDGETQQVHAGDAVLIPANKVHQIFNDSQSNENLIFLAVCLPAWTPDNSVYLD
jgi:mannose-6-phosphate isomerase-like protein (cupin superfamily)